ncbi:MAG: diaminopimelate epimerase [SAR86 cluster bacterium]|jgi:diaminopimelate epimerase|nr:diaminopimelate epimerase [SAR86 cluster bacterium]
MKVIKMSSLGNEILILDLLTENNSISPDQIKDFSKKKITSFDQLLTIEPPHNRENDLRTSIFNSDGSIAQNCINGSRCLAKYVVENKLLTDEKFIVETDGGNWHIESLNDGIFSTSMPLPRFKPSDLPFLHEPSENYVLKRGDKKLEVGIASIGNPHIVAFLDDIQEFPLKKWGLDLSEDKQFPEGVNFGIASITSRNSLNLRVYERGVGETLACGSGACAAVVIGNELNLLESRVNVFFKEGKLLIEYTKSKSLKAFGDAHFHGHFEF